MKFKYKGDKLDIHIKHVMDNLNPDFSMVKCNDNYRIECYFMRGSEKETIFVSNPMPLDAAEILMKRIGDAYSQKRDLCDLTSQYSENEMQLKDAETFTKRLEALEKSVLLLIVSHKSISQNWKNEDILNILKNIPKLSKDRLEKLIKKFNGNVTEVIESFSQQITTDN